MLSFPDSGWLRALDLKASTFAAVSLGCWFVFGAAEFGLLHLDILPAWVRALFAIIAVLATTLFLGRMWELGHERWRKHRWERGVLANLDNLNMSEDDLLGRQVVKSEQTFSIALNSPLATALRNKGLALPSPTGHPLGWTHTIPDFVWSELRRRQSALRATASDQPKGSSGDAPRPAADIRSSRGEKRTVRI